jgi:iron complex outermembrane receptor protein
MDRIERMRAQARLRSQLLATGLVSLACTCMLAMPMSAQQPDDLSSVSLDSLLNIRVSAASRYEQVTRTAPAAIVIVTADAIRSFGYQTLSDVLADVAGFYISNDRNYSYLGARGFSRPTDYNNRILVMLNGQRLNESFYGSAYIGRELGIDMRALDRIEIVRGPGSALFGTSAMFAVINLVTTSGGAPSGGGVSGRLSELGTRDVSADYGTRISGTDIRVSGQVFDRDGADLYYAEYDDPATNNGIAEHLDWERARSVLASVERGNFMMLARASTRDKGIPTGSWESAFNDDRARTSDDYVAVQAALSLPLAADKQLDLRGRFSEYEYRGAYPDGSEAAHEDENDVRDVGLEATLTWDLSSRHRVVAGLESNWAVKSLYRAWQGSAVYFDDDFPFATYSAYAQSESRLARWATLYVGLRDDLYADYDNALSPRAALIVTPDSATNIKLLWGNAFRSPNVYEREYYSTTNKRNPDLRAESIRTTELVLERRLGGSAQVKASIAHSDVSDLIDSIVDAADSMVYFGNVEMAHTTAAELELLWRNGPAEVRASYSFTSADAHGARLSNSPAHLAKSRVLLGLPYSTQLALTGRYESERRTVYGTDTEAAFLSDAIFHIPVIRNFEASVTARNIFNARFATPGGFEHEQAAITQDGRTLGVQMEWRF